MSLKSLFGKKSLSVVKDVSLEDLEKEVESVGLIKESNKDRYRYVPSVNWEEPIQFSRFGSAKKYYADALNYIQKTFPYDGSLKEKAEWHNSSSDLVNYFFDNVYPRNNGYITLGELYGNTIQVIDGYAQTTTEEYIKFNGTLNGDPSSSKLQKLFDKSNKLEIDKKRGYNIDINGDNGGTIEFYYLRQDINGSPKQVIFDVWNSASLGSGEYGRMKIEVRPSVVGEDNKFYFELSSGSAGIVDIAIGTDLELLDKWHHYAITYKNEGPELKIQLFVDGDLNEEIVSGTSISQIEGAISGQLGALITEATNSPGTQRGWGKLNASLDEFRFWKRKRTDREIAINYFSHVGGGTNTDDANTDLGLYFKFNEGNYTPINVDLNSITFITLETGEYLIDYDGTFFILEAKYEQQKIEIYDKTILDYSGRISNGYWVGYNYGSRKEGSAIVESGAAKEEYKDPLIFPNSPRVRYLHYYYSQVGEEYDSQNNTSMYSTLPSWMIEEDTEQGGTLENLTQIMSEFFDDLHIKISEINSIKNLEYKEGKPIPFSDRLLANYGFEVGELFSNSSLMEMFHDKSETENYEEKIYNVKNFIYQNIYNNIVGIYKSKGTEKSIRNLLRCFGIDEEILRLNIYSNNTKYTLEDRFQYNTKKKKYLDFNNVDNFGISVVQTASFDNPNSLGYLPGSSNLKYFGNTYEVETIFPRKIEVDSPLYFETNFVSCSIFGMHESSDYEWQNPDRASIQLFAVRDYKESKNVRFLLSSSCFSQEIQTELFEDVYENMKWNFSISLKHEKYPYFGATDGSETGNYILEFYGANAIQTVVNQSFMLTASIDSSLAESFYAANKMIYVGAHRQDFTGSVVQGPGVENNQHFCDAKISSVRVWNSYLGSKIIELHAKDVQNYGSEAPYGNLETFLSPAVNSEYISQIDSLALHWDFVSAAGSGEYQELHSSLGEGEFAVEDASSGSLELLNSTALSPYTKYQFLGKAIYCPVNTTSVVKEEYVLDGKRALPESMMTSDFVNILDADDEYFERDVTPVDYFFAIEKSMYQIISDDILRWFGTIRNFNNLIGSPHYRYESQYRDLQKLRSMYFATVQNTPDFDKFTSFYKWIDDAISMTIEQIIPGSMNYSNSISNMIESHILERNKYRHKLPTIELGGNIPAGNVFSINNLLYNWKNGHAPLDSDENKNCVWWKERYESEDERNGIQKVKKSSLNRKSTTVYNFNSYLNQITFDKKRETEIIRSEVGFDLSGADYFEITNLVSEDIKCED